MEVILNVERLKNTDGSCENICYDDDALSFKAKARNLDRIITVVGSFKYSFTENCDRCGDPVTYYVDCDFQEKFSNLQELVNENPLEEQELIRPFTGDEIDLFQYIDQQAFLDKPMKVLCCEDCQGLCPTCGCNLNNTSCNCNQESVDPRLAVLADLLKDHK